MFFNAQFAPFAETTTRNLSTAINRNISNHMKDFRKSADAYFNTAIIPTQKTSTFRQKAL
jgi:hypothetical protein